MPIFISIISRVVNLIFPRRCPVCQDVTPNSLLICPKCSKLITYVEEPVCMTCGKPFTNEEQEYCYDCKQHPKSFQRNYAVFLYDDRTKISMAAFKYNNKREFADYFAREFMNQYGLKLLSLGVEVVTAVPIHKKKRRQRGYNQAEILGKKIAGLLELPFEGNLLTREINTLPQKELNNIQRVKNLQMAFRAGVFHRNYYAVLIIDDIYTTGATMEACTKALLGTGFVDMVYGGTICIGKGY